MLTAVGCGAVRRGVAVAPDEPSAVGVYAGRLVRDGRSTRFKALVWARPVDRVHLELLPPIGGPVLIVDGGHGRLALIDPRAGVAWVGPASPDAFRRAVGLELDLEDLVAALLSGTTPPGMTLTREGGAGPALPWRLRLGHGDAWFELRLKRIRRLDSPVESLGAGLVPEGVERRPLDELPAGDAWIEAGR